jgi:hypothetical protein
MKDYFYLDSISKNQDVEVLDLVVTSALAKKCRNIRFLYDFLEFLDHADYESEIIFLIRPSGGPVWFAGVSHCEYMRYHDT